MSKNIKLLPEEAGPIRTVGIFYKIGGFGSDGSQNLLKLLILTMLARFLLVLINTGLRCLHHDDTEAGHGNSGLIVGGTSGRKRATSTTARLRQVRKRRYTREW